MLYLTAVDAVVVIAMAFWLRALLRSRGGDIPCTARIASPWIVASGVLALVGNVVVNVLGLKALDAAFGKHLSPVLFTAWLLTMSAGSILFIAALATLDTNRKALAWLRLAAPDELVVRGAGVSTTVKLEPASVRALLVGGGLGGAMYVQYYIRNGDRAIELVVPFTLAAGPATNGSPWLDSFSGLIAQGGARKLHRFFAPYCERHTKAAA